MASVNLIAFLLYRESDGLSRSGRGFSVTEREISH